MAVKIKLKRMGKMRNAQYRIVVADARTKRDGRAIEEIGIYQPKEEPSLIRVDSDRAQYWLGVGAQPTEAVTAILNGETAIGLSQLRDIVHALVTFPELARVTGISEKSLHRALSAHGNPTTATLGKITSGISKATGYTP